EHFFKGVQLRDDNDTPKKLTPLDADLSGVQWGQLLDTVQQEVMQGVLPHLPDADRRVAVAQLPAGTMTLHQASIFHQKAINKFKANITANSAEQAHA